MSIAIGDKLPAAELLKPGVDGPATVSLAGLLAGRKVVLFGVPGAFTPTCHSAHLPSFVRTREAFAAKGIDAVYCLAVNDPFVLAAWDEATGASPGGVELLSDPQSQFVRAVGLDFDAPPVGLMGRSKRFAMIVEDGVVRQISVEASPGDCEISAGEALLQVA